MKEIGSIMRSLLEELGMGPCSESDEALDVVEMTARQLEEYNASQGTLNEQDGYDCPVCHNKGHVGRLSVRNGYPYQLFSECACMDIRRSIKRLSESGLQRSVERMTFKAFRALVPWQETMLRLAKSYVREGADKGRWFYIGGQPGAGKTHICTAICGELLKKMGVRYVSWARESKRIRALATDAEAYRTALEELEKAQVLYIDDYLKTANRERPSAAETRLSFELLNARYLNDRPTILSSEWFLDELSELDEATASRIQERCGRNYALAIARDSSRNQRLHPREE